MMDGHVQGLRKPLIPMSHVVGCNLLLYIRLGCREIYVGCAHYQGGFTNVIFYFKCSNEGCIISLAVFPAVFPAAYNSHGERIVASCSCNMTVAC